MTVRERRARDRRASHSSEIGARERGTRIDLRLGDLRLHPWQRPMINVMNYVGRDGFEIGSRLQRPLFVTSVDGVKHADTLPADLP